MARVQRIDGRPANRPQGLRPEIARIVEELARAQARIDDRRARELAASGQDDKTEGK